MRTPSVAPTVYTSGRRHRDYLRHVGRSNKQLQAKDGYATTLDGERLSTTVKIPQTLDSGDTVKGTLIVPEWASRRFSSVKHNFYVGEKDFHWNPQLILK